MEVKKEKFTPVCISGQSNCPSEDCGGVPGFHELVKAMRNGSGSECDNFVRWLGKKYDPDIFHFELTNGYLKDWKRYVKKREADTFSA